MKGNRSRVFRSDANCLGLSSANKKRTAPLHFAVKGATFLPGFVYLVSGAGLRVPGFVCVVACATQATLVGGGRPEGVGGEGEKLQGCSVGDWRLGAGCWELEAACREHGTGTVS